MFLVLDLAAADAADEGAVELALVLGLEVRDDEAVDVQLLLDDLHQVFHWVDLRRVVARDHPAFLAA